MTLSSSCDWPVNSVIFKKAHFGLPYVSLKLATTIDGKIAMSSGESKWITGDIARKFGHILRASHDAVVIGSETAINDDPQLTCRISGVENDAAIQPIRVALDRRLRIPANANLVNKAVVRAVRADSSACLSSVI